MELNRKNMTKIFLLAAAIILFYLGFKHMNVVFSFINWMMKVLTPFLIAGCVVFLLNVPLKAIEKHLFRPKKGKPVSRFKEKARRPIAIALSITLFVGLLTAFLVIIIPEISKSLVTLAGNIPGFIRSIQEWATELSERDDMIGQAVKQLDINWDKIGKTATDFLSNNSMNLVNVVINIITSLFGLAINIFLGFVLAVYILFKKEKISSDVKKLIYSVFPVKKADFIVEVGHLTNKSFYNSITGQMIECLIVGCLTALGMTIFGFPYAALGGVVVALMSWIPMFGIYIGTGVVALLLLISDPMQALWFVIYMVILQQIEGNLIFPRVVGSKIGLPPIILISAIILFSNFFGVIGLLVCGPVTFVLYTLIRRFVYKRLEDKKIPKKKYEIHYDSEDDDDELEQIQKELDEQARQADSPHEAAQAVSQTIASAVTAAASHQSDMTNNEDSTEES